MFRTATAEIREVLYGIIARSNLGATTSHALGSGVMVAPGFVVTNAHILHLDGNLASSVQREFLVIRSPDIGRDAVSAQLFREDTARDLALLKVDGGASRRCVSFETQIIPSGTSCGSLGFPLAALVSSQNCGVSYSFTERFQGAFISAYITERVSDRLLPWYEVDRVMYGGSSGCPFFTQDGKVVGLQTRVRNAEKNASGTQNFLAISLLIPSPEVIGFIKSCGIN
jgi:S1-C subfamily serine protease